MSNGRYGKSKSYGDRTAHGSGQSAGHERSPSIDTPRIQLGKPTPELFDEVAHEAAKAIAAGKPLNKPAQIRRFFDELLMWEAKVNGFDDQNDDIRKQRFDDALPFIRMMNAKVAYAEGRKLVDANFQTLFNHCIKQVESPASLRHFRLFFEAFLGFYKVERPSDN